LKIISILLFFLTYTYSASIVDTKQYNGETYYIVKSQAKVMKRHASKEYEEGKDLVFDNLNGEVALSDVSQTALKNYNIGDKVTIYFAVKSNNKSKQFYRVFFNKTDVKLNSQYTSNTIKKSSSFNKNKISTEPIYSFLTKTPIFELIYKNNEYKYVNNTSNLKVYLAIAFALFITYMFLKSFNIIGVAIGLLMLGSFYLYFLMTNSETFTFDLNTEEFYKGKTIQEARTINAYTSFKNIYAFQILKSHDFIQTDLKKPKEYFDVYSLNIVLNDGNRINIMAHEDYKQILQDAHTLSTALGKPVFDQTDIKRVK